ncbi:putative spermidine/putrescine transport system ATP-binding protein [Tepidamorphus gemmatus]|uniref:Spermidine/putrescine import ATP-binding protein PotA n=1 Tax=Tepidamorphus gemmatus TaxID=747076 RepID=A0A4R3M5S0_9HYPH|nr:ABC transporter ATP-binding protein [Tepidamorphus gemmatus]TCT08714.1 putative spermidine/putrescine transport system ATP-binding protein [Tepidamorphus gemmatus]
MTVRGTDRRGRDDPHVRFRDVQKSYDGQSLVVKNLNLDIERGEFLTMLGPSGSGKTTCLMMLAGFETATHGEILLDGRPINNVPPHRRGIGMVFQNYALFPHMTVAENLAFPLQVRKLGRAEIEARVKRALEMVELPQMGGRMPGQLSGGQQQRVAVARALVFEPQLVLMDEPLGALDKQLREQMQYEIKHIHQNIGVTVVYVTHDQSEALTMSDRIAVFNDGVIQQLSRPDVLYEAPENSFVAQFIGENNRLTGRIVRLADGLCEVEVSGAFVKALAVRAGAVGDAAMLSIRPERVAIGEAAAGLDNRFEGRVEELIYLGDHIRARLCVCGRDDFFVKVPNAPSRLQLTEQAIVPVGWAATDCRALDAPATA